MNKYAVIDLETTGHTPAKGDRIIEVGIVVWSEGKIIEKYATLVNPEINIPRFITNLTGITDEAVSDQPTFDEIAAEIRGLFDNAYFVAHNVPFDMGFLNEEFKRVGLPVIMQPVIDTVELSRIMLPQAPGFKLGQLASWLKLQHDDPHRALSDAYVTTYLMSHLLKIIDSLPYETIKQLEQLEPKLKSDLGVILQNRADSLAFSTNHRDDLEIFRGIALKKQHLKPKALSNKAVSFGEIMDNFYQNEGELAYVMPAFELRSGQREMSEHIFDAFQSKRHAIIEAETGTGKSLAYLVTALFQAINYDERVVVSTHLTQLQSQLVEKEIPLLKKILPFTFQTAIMKGKQHYLSLAKFEQTLRSLDFDNYDIILTKAIILIWLTETSSGDIDEIQLPSSGERFFRLISTEAEGGLDPNSPWFTRSFYYRAKANAQRADLVITNHALLCANMTSETPLLPSFKKIIIDEAHHLETTASKHFGLSLDYLSIQKLLQSIGCLENNSWIKKLAEYDPDISIICDEYEWDKWWQEAKEETDGLFRYIFHYVEKKQSTHIAINDIGRFQYRIQSEGLDQGWEVIIEMVNRISFQLRDLIHILSRILKIIDQKRLASDYWEEVKWNMERLQRVLDGLENYFIKNLAEDEVKWIEIDAFGARNAVYLFQEPIDIAQLLHHKFLIHKDSVIMTSATLTIKESFSIFKERIGIKEGEAIEKKIISPYTYQDQVQLMVPNDFPHAKYGKMESFIEATCEAIVSLAQITDGRMLVLFTSYDMLKKAYALLRDMMEESYILIAQGVSSGSRARLKKNFQTFDQAILLGTSSFWEGIDIPGSDLSCVVIVRLPFEPPNHPVYDAKANYLKKTGKNPFMTLALPNAVIRFKQGFGRLIRSSTDRGIVFICDDRLMKAKYGNYFIDSIPNIPIHYNSTKELMEIAEDWL
ncbi:ATP-dependent helicase DinG [Paraliobacillus quinghaiensis]|uniref:3'-5' exonuclease DinG n=1 Tax=Paraliobacillus quinghaiensis TaxID=470815 RepID=A0A917WRC8_9BACI|nr:ATP-dependent DNA helicase DinG [Paraliobacillus quinghaiensis]GGM23046.1 ATP-dependent helicase DinG [Paraliobacillus quinghaiensis]